MLEAQALVKSVAKLPAVEAVPAADLPAPQQEALAAIKAGLSFPQGGGSRGRRQDHDLPVGAVGSAFPGRL